jgi:hypothetical protein
MKKIEIREMHLDEADKHIVILLATDDYDENGQKTGSGNVVKTLYKSDGIESVKEFFNEYNLNENILIDFIDSIWNQGFTEQANACIN